MPSIACAIFPTPIGPCAIAWTPAGIAGVLLPEADQDATRRRLRARFPGAADAAPPAPIAHAIDSITALLQGLTRDLTEVPLDWTGVPDFPRRVYEVARTIPPGSTRTYGDVAARVGAPGAAQAVGQALGANPFPLVVPCHRVLAASGDLGGFSAPGGAATKRRLLEIEGAIAKRLF